MGTVVMNFKYIQKEYLKAARQHLFMSNIISKPSVVLAPLLFAYDTKKTH